EPLLEPWAYGPDRVFVRLHDEERPDAQAEQRLAALAEAGHPTLTVSVEGSEGLGGLFFIAEFATAVAGWVLEINPFDQPNVAEAKEATKRVLAVGALPELPVASIDAVTQLLRASKPGNYIALMGYVAPSVEFDEEVSALRATLMERTKLAVTFGYGPRFLHSTGQLHKGGAPIGRFLSLICDSENDVEIPGQPFTFRTLKDAQALGDLETLRAHKLPAEIVRLEGDPAQALRTLHNQIKEIV
ncbi:MAG TPA: hypothetical protein VIH49_02470, partial [Solirubrobacteraceae bacterium]